MAKNQPVQLKVVSVGRVSQYNKQKIQAIHPNGAQFEVNLGDKSPKVAEGQSGDYMFEIWQYTPPGKTAMWCGRLVQPIQQQGPQPALQGPQQAIGSPSSFPSPQNVPNNKDRLEVAKVVYKTLSTAFTGALDEFDAWLADNQSLFSRHVDWIMQVGQSFEKKYNIPDEQQGSNDDRDTPFR